MPIFVLALEVKLVYERVVRILVFLLEVQEVLATIGDHLEKAAS